MGFAELALREGERLLMSGVANKWQTVGSKGGVLFLTDQRIVFQAHSFNFGSKFDEYDLSQIQTQGNTVNIKTRSNIVSYNITFYTKSGQKLSFVVTRSQKNEWIQQITEAIKMLERSNVFTPENISESEIGNITAKTKTVQCEGCGALMIVTLGNVTKCDYCGRPTIG